MTAPINVRLRTRTEDRDITYLLRGDPTYTLGFPGGYKTCTLQFAHPLTASDVAAYDKLYLYDSRHSGLLWEGELQDPGRTADADGQVWSLVAVGGGAHLSDVTRPLMYVDTVDLGQLVRSGSSLKNADAGADASGYYRLSFPRGLVVTAGFEIGVNYNQLMEAGLELARVDMLWDAGSTPADGNTRVQVVVYPSGTVVRDQALNSGGSAKAPRYVGTHWAWNAATPDNQVKFRLYRQTTNVTISDDVTWVVMAQFSILGVRYDADGTKLTSGYGTNTVTAVQVIRDLLGRMLPRIDGTNAVLSSGSGFEFEQLAYRDGADALKVHEDLMRGEPNMGWAVWESSPATGLFRYEWVPWPTTVRYEATAEDGFDAPGSNAELYNELWVRWRDPSGIVRWTRRTRAVQALTDAGLTRTGPPIDLGDEVGSATTAQQAGDAFLAEHATPPNTATLTIARPIYDTVLGRMVDPHEIRSPALIRVADVHPRPDALNPTDRDGVTVFRIVDLSVAGSVATLDLDATGRGIAALVARQRMDFKRARKR